MMRIITRANPEITAEQKTTSFECVHPKLETDDEAITNNSSRCFVRRDDALPEAWQTRR